MKKKANKADDQLLSEIIDAIQDKKGRAIVKMDLRDIPHAVCDYYIICHGDSNTQVSAIADSVEERLIQIKQKPRSIEGVRNSQWILVDLFNVIVHIFQKEARDFYNIEDLWADGKITHIKD